MAWYGMTWQLHAIKYPRTLRKARCDERRCGLRAKAAAVGTTATHWPARSKGRGHGSARGPSLQRSTGHSQGELGLQITMRAPNACQRACREPGPAAVFKPGLATRHANGQASLSPRSGLCRSPVPWLGRSAPCGYASSADGRDCGHDRPERWNDCILYNDGTIGLATVTTNDPDW